MTITLVTLPEIFHIQLNGFDSFTNTHKKLKYPIKNPSQINLTYYKIKYHKNIETNIIFMEF
jgi:hypothetical protein